jgi:hypothetical protein
MIQATVEFVLRGYRLFENVLYGEGDLKII